MRYLIASITFFLSNPITAQQVHKVFRNPSDSTQNFYVVRTPKYPIKGLLVLNDRALSDSSKKKAYNLGICTITVVPTSDYLQNLTSNSLLVTIDEMISEAIKSYNIPKNKIIVGGMSVAGTGAIRYVQYCFANKSINHINPIAVFAIDPPLDYERLWNEAQNSVMRNYNKEAVDEGNVLMKVLKEKMLGTPITNINSYRRNSPFCYSDSSNQNVTLLKNVAVRLYVEPDITWWIKNRGKDYHDINAIDNAALINQLKLAGNNNAELITSTNKGYQEDGTRHPHSWSILNEYELLIWCEKMFKETK